ncbi:MAG: anti-sigma factor family protein [Terriglobales bacterium]
MDCYSLYDALGDFLEGEVSPLQAREIASHLADCPQCHCLVVNCRSMILLYRKQQPQWTAGAVPIKLHQKMMERVIKKLPSDRARNPIE